MGSKEWNAAIAQYVTAMRAANRSPGTIRLHRHYLRQLPDLRPDPYAVTTADLRTVLSRDGWAPETRKSARSVYRSFYRWAHLSRMVKHNPAAPLEPVHVPRPEPRPTPEMIVQRLMREADPRLRLMGMLAAYAGLRAAEIARVHSNDLQGDRLRVHGKGSKIRTVPIVHLALYDALTNVGGYAFPGRTDGHLSPGHVTKLLSRALPGDWTAHTLRHRCATAAYAGTRDLFAVQEILGHSKSDTTRRYVQLPDDAMRAALTAASAA